MSSYINTQYPAVTYRQSKKDKRFYIRYKKDGKPKIEPIGNESEGITAKKAYDVLVERKKSTNEKVKNILKDKSYTLERLSKVYFEELRVKAKRDERLPLEDRKHKSDKNIRKEESAYKNFWGDWKLRKTKLHSISEKKLADFLYEKRQKYSHKTVTNAIGIVKSIIKHTNYNGEHPFDLKEDISTKQAFRAKKNQRKRFLSENEMKMLLECAKEELSKQSYVMILTSLMTGARPDSVVHLKTKDIDFNNAKITFWDFKRKMYYSVPLAKKLSDELKDVYDKKNKYIFYSRVSKGIKSISGFPKEIKHLIHKLFNQELEDEDEKVVIYTFRHTFANMLLQVKKLPVAEVSHLLNHASIQTTTENYIHMSNDYISNADLSDLI